MSETRDPLRPFRDHGVHLSLQGGTGQATGECPFCGKKKFFYGIEKEQWQCKVCGKRGNVYTFLRELWGASLENCQEEAFERLAHDRGLLSYETLADWGVCQGLVTGEWLVPGFNHEGTLTQLYRYVKLPGEKKAACLATAGLSAALFKAPDYSSKKPETWYCEGPWDAMVAWEVLRQTREHEGRYSRTANQRLSLGGRVNVLGVPGDNTFKEKWGTLAAGHKAVLLFDNDHPGRQPRTGEPVEPSAWSGMRRAARTMCSHPERPESIHYLAWNEGGEDHEATLPSGFDMRDMLSSQESVEGRVEALGELVSMIQPMPEGWVEGRGTEGVRSGGTTLKPLPCKDYATCVVEWQRAMRWTEGLERFLRVCLATAVSTRQGGDQLWIRGVSPPSTGKTTIAEAIGTAGEEYVEVVSQFTGLYSGMMTDAEASEDLSLVAKLQNKVFIIKEGNTLTESSNVEQLMSQLRDLYDRKTRSSFKNRASRKYSTNCVNIICGTEAMRRSLDEAELGSRYLDCRIMTRIDTEVERDVVKMKVLQADAEVQQSAVGEGTTHHSPELTKAMQVTGGYVRYLMENSTSLLRAVERDTDALAFCGECGLLVAYLRSRPSEKHDEEQEREFAARLPAQFVRLARCLAAAMNRRTNGDTEVLKIVRQTALDTCWGRTAQIARLLYREGEVGAEARAVSYWLSLSAHKVRDLLQFLTQIRVAERFEDEVQGVRGATTVNRWRLTSELRSLWASVVESPYFLQRKPVAGRKNPVVQSPREGSTRGRRT